MALEAIDMHQPDVALLIDFLTLVVDSQEVRSIPIIQKQILNCGDASYVYHTMHWIPPLELRKTVRKVFTVLNNYLESHKQAIDDAEYEQKYFFAKQILTLVNSVTVKIDKLANNVGWRKGRLLVNSSEFKEIQLSLQARLKTMAQVSLMDEADAVLFHSKQKLPSIMQLNMQWDKLDRTAIDLSKVMQDLDYELMLIKSIEDKFLVPSTLLKTGASKVGSQLVEDKSLSADQLADLYETTNKLLHAYAFDIKSQVWYMIKEYLPEARKYKKSGIHGLLVKALMALMLSASEPAAKMTMRKTALDYYKDYIHFTRQALSTHVFKGWLLSPSSKSRLDRFAYQLLGFSIWCKMRVPFYKHELIMPLLEKWGIIHSPSIQTSFTYDQVIDLLKGLPSVLGSMMHPVSLPNRDHKKAGFYPNIKGYLPTLMAGLKCAHKSRSIPIISVCTPVQQKRIDQAVLSDEMRLFFSYYQECRSNRKIVILDLEDSMSWKELARSKATYRHVASLQEKNLQWVNLPLKGLIEQVVGEGSVGSHEFISNLFETLNKYHELYPTSYKLDAILREIISEQSLNELLNLLGLKQLSHKQQCFVIELLVSWMALVSIDSLDPDFIWVLSKSGVDYGPAFIAQWAFLLQDNNSISRDEFLPLLTRLLGPCLINRRRGLVHEEIHNLCCWIENLKKVHKAKSKQDNYLQQVLRLSLDDLGMIYPV